MAQVRPRAAVLATIGSVGVVTGAYFEWTENRLAQVIPLRKLLFVGNVTGDAPSYWLSMAAPLAVVTAVGVLGALLLSRLVLLIAFLLGVATVGLWVATDLAESEGGIAVGNIGLGAWITTGSLLLTLIALIALRSRSGGEEIDEEDEDGPIRPYSPLPRTYGDGDAPTRIGPGTGPTTTPGSNAPPGAHITPSSNQPGPGKSDEGQPGGGQSGAGQPGRPRYLDDDDDDRGGSTPPR